MDAAPPVGAPPPSSTAPPLEYVGFWPRVWASVLDTLWIMPIVVVLGLLVYGRVYLDGASLVQGPMDLLISYALPAVLVVAFWIRRLATPGKLAIGARIVDARTGVAPTTRQFVIRYLGYFLSTIPLGLGLLWVAFDARRQGWHDKLAGTVVVRPKRDASAAFPHAQRG